MKPTVLFISQCLPFPPNSGVTNRTFHILEALAKEFEVNLLAFYRKNHQPTTSALDAAIVGIQALGVKVAGTFPIRSERSTVSKGAVHLASLLGGRPYTFHDYVAAGFQQTLEGMVEGNRPRLVHLDSLDLFRWLPIVGPIPITCTHHSIESELLRLRGQHVKSRTLAAYLLHQAGLVEAVEKRVCPRIASNLMMSDLDAERLRRLAQGSRTVTVPNGVDLEFMVAGQGEEVNTLEVVFLGPTYMFPNRDGIQYFVTEVWPLVRNELPDARFTVVGRVQEPERTAWEAIPGVRCLGFVDDIRPTLRRASCCVCPLRVGGGTRLKVLDYWAMERAVVSTTIGAEGLDAVDGKNILLRDDPRGFAAAVVAVLRDGAIRRSLGAGARATVERLYSWEAIGSDLCNHYRALIESLPLMES